MSVDTTSPYAGRRVGEVLPTVLREIEKTIRRGWCRFNMATNVANQPVPELSPKAMNWCLVGAVHEVCQSSPLLEQITLRLLRDTAQRLYGYDSLVEFNDAQRDVYPLTELLRAARQTVEKSITANT